MTAPFALFVFVSGMQRAVWQVFLCFFCFDSLTLQLISRIDAIINVIKHGVQQKVQAE